MKWILKKGVRFPELKPAAFAIWALGWCSAGRTSYSLWVMLAPGGAGDVNPFQRGFLAAAQELYSCFIHLWTESSKYMEEQCLQGSNFCEMWGFLWAVASSWYLPSQSLKHRDRVTLQVLLAGTDVFLLKSCRWNCQTPQAAQKTAFFLMSSISQMIQASYWTTVLQQKLFWRFHILSCFEFFSYSFSFMCRTST